MFINDNRKHNEIMQTFECEHNNKKTRDLYPITEGYILHKNIEECSQYWEQKFVTNNDSSSLPKENWGG